MIWALVIVLGLATFGALLLLRLPRVAWEAVGATLLVGIAGYALQASPGLPGAPKPPAEPANEGGSALVDARNQLAQAQASGQGLNRWLVIGDALARNGQFGDAAAVILGAVEREPRNANAWLALANALMGHSEGNATPAALYAFRRAAAADPEHPGPPFFMGLALIQGGEFAKGRAMWAELLRRSPADAPWRADLEDRIKQLDAIIAMRDQQLAGQPTPQR